MMSTRESIVPQCATSPADLLSTVFVGAKEHRAYVSLVELLLPYKIPLVCTSQPTTGSEKLTGTVFFDVDERVDCSSVCDLVC